MTAFRKCFLALAVLVVVLGSIAPASAQVAPFTCNTTAAPPRMRYEGVTELIGDIVLTFGGQLNSTNTGSVNVRVNIPNYNVTSRLVGPAGNDGGYPTDALIVVQGPTGTPYTIQSPGSSPTTCAGSGNNVGAGCEWQGTWYATDPDSITFNGVAVLPPGTAGTISYRITNVRIDATVAPNPGTGSTIVPGYISVSPSTALPVTTASATVGFISYGLVYESPAFPTASGVYAFGGTGNIVPPTFLQCQTYVNAPVATIRFQEGFADSFKRVGYVDSGVSGQDQPGASFSYASESGFINSDGGAYPAPQELGEADAATQLEAVITGLPVGATLLVANNNVCDDANCVTYVPSSATPPPFATGTWATLNGGSTSPTNVNGVNYTPIVIGSTGSVDLIWTVISEVPVLIEDFDFPLLLSSTPNVNAGTPQATSGPVNVVLGFYPTVTELCSGSTNTACITAEHTANTGAIPSGPIPRFVPSNNEPAFGTPTLLNVTLCQTLLLYPYVTDVFGYNTGMAVSNTSLDPFGTIPAGSPATAQAGTCAVNFYGTGSSTVGTAGQITSVATGFGTSGVIEPGETWAFDVAQYDSNYVAGGGFSGYAIAACNFQFAHGYAFVSDLNIEHFATSYLALIIPNVVTTTGQAGPRIAEPNTCVGNSSLPGCTQTGEQLAF